MKWLSEVKFSDEYTKPLDSILTEKLLEHYLSTKILDLNENDVFIDVGGLGSPWYDLAEKRYKCKSFLVDLKPIPKGDNRVIKSNAVNMPFDDENISKIALHCSFETFENDADTCFIKEACRVLKPRGKMVIVPLYMHHFYCIMSSPYANRSGIEYGNAKRVWYDDRFIVRFARHYSVEAFKERVANQMNKLSLKIYYFTNEKDMKIKPEDRVYVKFAACFTKE